MIRKLLIVAAASGLVSIACFFCVHLMGGLHTNLGDFADGQSWGHSHWGDRWDEAAGPDVSKDLPWAGGAEIAIAYPSEVTYTQGPVAKFTVRGPQGLIDRMELEDGRLTGPHHGHHGRKLQITIVSPDTHEFHLSGAQDLKIANYDQDVLILHVSGAADVHGQGKARRLEAHISGAGDLDLGDLPVQDAEVSISGAGDAKLDAKTSADVSISGAGSVRLKSRPPMFRSHISGFGSIDAPEAPPPASSAPPAAPAAPAKSKV
jgi:hypothetical protein